jgi:hypothetical protein
MQTSVKLQEPFSYSIIPLIIAICIILAITYYLIHKKRKKEKVKEENIKIIPTKNIKNIPVIKGKYLEQIDSIEYKYNEKKINLRQAYQLISQTIRMFVFEVTDITTQNYTLKEIKKLNIPKLYELIEEYYEPEFASKSVGDLEASIQKARRVIKQWN